MEDGYIKTTYYASMFQLETERLHLAVWDNEGFYLNAWTAYNSIPMVDIIDGKMEHTVNCYNYDENFQPFKHIVTVSMQVQLAEIWDFFLMFTDWKTSSIQNMDKPDEEISSYLDISMESEQAIWNSTSSKV